MIERRRQAVDVGPRSLLVRGQLLGGGIARREDRRQRRRAIGHRRPRRAEVDQRRVVLGIEDDVGRLDVAMQEARLVDLLEAAEQPLEQTLDDRRRQLLVALQALLERLAARQPHDHVGRAVGLEEVVDADDRGNALERRQNAGLLEKALAAPDEVFGKLRRARHDRRAVFAQRQRCRQIFLDRDFAAERRVAGVVGDAETAVAEDGNQLIVAQLRSRRKRAAEFVRLGVCLGIGHHTLPSGIEVRRRRFYLML